MIIHRLHSSFLKAKKCGEWMIYAHSVTYVHHCLRPLLRYFVDDLRFFQDYMTVELLYRQSRQSIMKGDILTDCDTIFELAACTMQAQHGDFRK